MSSPTEAGDTAPDADKLAFLGSVVEAIDQGFVVWDDDDCLLICNQRFRDLWGYPDDLAKPGTSALDLLRHYLEAEGHFGKRGEDGFEAEIDRRYKVILAAHGRTSEGRFSHFSGRELYIHRYRVPEIGNIATYSDISRLKDTEDQLIHKTNQLQSILNAVDQGVVIWAEDDDERLEICNEAFLKLWGHPEKFGEPGTRAMDLVTFSAEQGELGSGDPAELAQSYLNRLKDSFEEEVDDVHTTREGKKLYIRRRVIPGVGSVSTFTDVSALKTTEDHLRDTRTQLELQIEQLQQREAELEKQKSDLEKLSRDLDRARAESEKLNEEKDQLFSVLAHDLLGPFNAIIGFSSLLKQRAEDLAPDKIAEAADAINESATSLHQLLASLLEWSRTQMDGAVVELIQVDLHSVASDARDVFLPLASQKKIRIVSEIEELTMITDRNMIGAVIRNLLSNAVKFTPEGGVITMRLGSKNGEAIIEVSDTGVGIPPDQIDSVFSLDRLKSGTGTFGETGTGLGLQLCKGFVEQLGGKITLDSKVGSGTRFVVHLPLDFDRSQTVLSE